jgi:P4 family phage/plasmid primase-like protien
VTAPALRLYDRGYTELVSVSPPGATLSPGSKLSANQLGKAPARRLANGTWVGYRFTDHVANRDDAERWVQWGANIGLLAENFPALDIDSMDEWMVRQVMELALATFGPTPWRVGKAPKTLLPYRLEGAPFGRMAIIVVRDGQSNLIEFLGKGRQYLVYGTHPSGSAYRWGGDYALWDIDPEMLPTLSLEQARAFLDTLTDLFEGSGCEVQRVGDGRVLKGGDLAQEALVAPSLEVLEQAVALIPNTDEFFPDRRDYMRMGHAIRASWPESEEDAFAVFAEWAGRHPKDGRVAGNPDTPREDWRRFRPPFQLGWSWIAETARRFGFVDAALDFEKVEQQLEDARPDELELKSFKTEQFPDSDEWVGDLVRHDSGHLLRFVPKMGVWFCWDGSRWQKDAVNLAEARIRDTTRKMGARLAKYGGSEQEAANAAKRAMMLTSANKMKSVLRFLQSSRELTATPEAFDTNPWILNTPGGTVDLKTGLLGPSDPELMCSKRTAVVPDPSRGLTLWDRFLDEATAGNKDLQRYLQKWAGYALTGLTIEQKFLFIWGPGGRGKGTFLRAIGGILADYHTQASMDTFAAANGEKHPTDLASMLGARMVTANETQDGKRWDEARVKELTGGDRVSARFMRQDFFEYKPQFKLFFIGNFRPEIRNVDAAMRRRLYLVPFVTEPKLRDLQLDDKLQAEEWPAILSWMIEGCLLWQREGLVSVPGVVREATDEYFGEQDSFSRWIQDCTVESDENTRITSAFQSWREWAGRKGEWVGTERRFTNGVLNAGLKRGRDEGVPVFLNLSLKQQTPEGLG